jgi:hypothetical protein
LVLSGSVEDLHHFDEDSETYHFDGDLEPDFYFYLDPDADPDPDFYLMVIRFRTRLFS